MSEENSQGENPDPVLMDMGEAIRAMKDGCCVQRLGWNGKNMYLYIEHMVPGPESSYWSMIGSRRFVRTFDPVIVMRTATGSHQPGWLASQADLLAKDWQIIPDPDEIT